VPIAAAISSRPNAANSHFMATSRFVV